MDKLYQMLKEREELLMSLERKITEYKEYERSPHLQVSVMNGHPRFFVHTPVQEDGPATHRYLKSEESELAARLAQQEYDHRLGQAVSEELSLLRKMLRCCREDALAKALTRMHPAKQELVRPAYLPDDEFRRQWEAEEYTGNAYDFGNSQFYTIREERVRSKSEITIADRLYLNQIPYRYEAPLVLPNGKVIYPDFTILNVRERKVYYWEHFGRMQDPEYVNGFLYKMEQYAAMGILPGKNLICTYESDAKPLDVRSVTRSIEEYLI